MTTKRQREALAEVERLIGPWPADIDALDGMTAAQIRARTPHPSRDDNLAVMNIPDLEALAVQIRERARHSRLNDARMLERQARLIDAEIGRRKTTP
jgi:hypothetical protein